jgi:hypothetical protein
LRCGTLSFRRFEAECGTARLLTHDEALSSLEIVGGQIQRRSDPAVGIYSCGHHESDAAHRPVKDFHWCCSAFRFALSASIRFEAPALVGPAENHPARRIPRIVSRGTEVRNKSPGEQIVRALSRYRNVVRDQTRDLVGCGLACGSPRLITRTL